jgi:transposase
MWTDEKARRGEPVCVPSSFAIHGLRTCHKCRKTLNRDVNAAANMARVGVCQVFGAEHPSARRACETRGELYSHDSLDAVTAEALSGGASDGAVR